MTTSPSTPQPIRTCTSMDQIRDNIDRLDQQLVPLLAERLAYVEQAASFKPTRADVVVPWRIEDVVTKAKGHATACNMDLRTIETIYRALVSASIDREAEIWDQNHPNE